MKQFHEISSQISEAVQLSGHPVAIKFIDDLGAFMGKPIAKGHRFCQLVMRARQGDEFLLTPGAISCPGAAAALGFKPLPPKLEGGDMLKSLGIFADPLLGARTIRAMPRVEMGRYQGVAAGPLGEVNFVPDVVIIEDEVEKLMWIALAWLNGRGGRLEFSTAILQAICVDCAVIPFTQNRLNMTFGCYGCRDATDAASSEALLGFPGGKLPMVAENLTFLKSQAIDRSRAKNVYKAFAQRTATAGSQLQPHAQEGLSK